MTTMLDREMPGTEARKMLDVTDDEELIMNGVISGRLKPTLGDKGIAVSRIERLVERGVFERVTNAKGVERVRFTRKGRGFQDFLRSLSSSNTSVSFHTVPKKP